MNPFTDFEWIPFDCDKVINDNHFLCENHFTIIDGEENTSKEHLIIKYHSNCPIEYVYSNRSCWRIVGRKYNKKTLQIRKGDVKDLGDYLSAWSYGYENRSGVAIGNADQCIMSTGLPLTYIKTWTAFDCPSDYIDYKLIHTTYVDYHKECTTEEAKYYKCKDKSCALSYYVCDGFSDCSDNSDESSCDKSMNGCTDIQFQCISGIL